VTASPAPGELLHLPQPDGSVMRLRKLHADYDPTDRVRAAAQVQALQAQGEVVTGLLYVEPQAHDLHHAMNTMAGALNRLGESELCPGTAVLDRINQGLR
jgi:2-oxoglutarate ferredoxin oxidoreductase subunit beta